MESNDSNKDSSEIVVENTKSNIEVYTLSQGNSLNDSLSVIFNMLKESDIDFVVKEVKAQKVSGAIYVNKKYIGKRVILIIGN